jgi:hypothetical protein
MTDFRSLCAELLKGLDENKHEEVNYPGHLRVVMAKARAALAEPQSSADGEVGEIQAALRGHCQYLKRWGCDTCSIDIIPALTCAAKLLERLSDGPAVQNREPASVVEQPIPVSERLQQIEDLAADAMAGLRYIEHWHGRLSGVGWDRLHEKATRLNPAHALPLPSGEVE